MNVYDFTVKNNQGKDVSLKEYEGKVLLIVNTATECGFTPQYSWLQKLFKKYEGQGFMILDFPCNQFGHQAPGTADEIAQFCQGRFGVTFPQFAKIDVNGKEEAPLYRYLKSQKGFAGFDPKHKITPILEGILSKDDPDYKKNPDIKWNFTKFLIDRKGGVVCRFEPTAAEALVEEKVKTLL